MELIDHNKISKIIKANFNDRLKQVNLVTKSDTADIIW